jgi:hypothetical protein
MGRPFWKNLCVTWPGARLQIFPQSISLRLLWRELILPREHITTISKRAGWLSQGITIIHRLSSLKPTITFWVLWSSVLEDINAVLTRFGYPVEA